MKEQRNPLVPVLFGVGLALAFVVGIVAWGAGHYTNRTQTVTVAGTGTKPTAAASVSPEVAAGGHVFVQFACGQFGVNQAAHLNDVRPGHRRGPKNRYQDDYCSCNVFTHGVSLRILGASVAPL